MLRYVYQATQFIAAVAFIHELHYWQTSMLCILTLYQTLRFRDQRVRSPLITLFCKSLTSMPAKYK